MKPAALAFSGSIASGKSTIAAAVADAFHWPCVSFGNYVRFVARSQGLVESREVLQEIGADLVEKDVAEFSRAVLAQADWQPGQSIVIDGIRHVTVLASLRKLVAPTKLFLVFVETDKATRSARLFDRDAINLEIHQHLELHSTEQQVKSTLAKMSDLLIYSTHSPEVLAQQITHWLEAQHCFKS
jgi:dephospho-CoA kinase